MNKTMNESYMVLYKAYMINVVRDHDINVETPLYTTKEECIKHAEHLLKTCVSPEYDDNFRVEEVPDFSGYSIKEVPVYTHFYKNNKR